MAMPAGSGVAVGNGAGDALLEAPADASGDGLADAFRGAPIALSAARNVTLAASVATTRLRATFVNTSLSRLCVDGGVRAKLLGQFRHDRE